MADFTPTQGRYLAYIHAYTSLRGYPPAESEIAGAMCVSPPSVNQMVKALEKRGLIERQPGQARTIRILVPESDIPPWNNRKAAAPGKSSPAAKTKREAATQKPKGKASASDAAPANLYVLNVYLKGGPTGPKFANKEISRAIEIRGDQTLEQLHDIIFAAYDRYDEHLYEFQFGKRPMDPAGPKYGIGDEDDGDARETTLDELELKPKRVFGYWFDFGDDWYHQIAVDKIESAIPTVKYPRVIRRVGKSPPQYPHE